MKNAENKTVFVGLSGGVDSSVAAARLVDAGYKVVGVFIKVWHPDWMVCNWEQERLDAMRVSAHLDIPFLTCDAEDAYKNDVANYFINEYKAGRTPNPDVMCNQYVKFGRFLEFAKSKGADFIATGHYAQRIENETAELHRGVDTGKDQTYFLWTLSTEQLDSSLFPIGNTPKEDIRKEAEKLGIPVAYKKDSQGICFLGHVDIADFLSHYTDLTAGHVLNLGGAIIGSHKGALVYTRGQRHGFTISTQNEAQPAMYVVDRDLSKNTITVSDSLDDTKADDNLILSNITLRQPISESEVVDYQIRYRQTPLQGEVISVTADQVILRPLAANPAPAAGQSCVIYKETLCVGGGIII